MKSMRFIDYDASVMERLSCGIRVLLLGAIPQIYQMCHLGSNYSQKELPCNFAEGVTYFSLFKTEGYGSKTARISDSQFVCIAQNHTAILDVNKALSMELL